LSAERNSEEARGDAFSGTSNGSNFMALNFQVFGERFSRVEDVIEAF
jgi:hypothetical protein